MQSKVEMFWHQINKKAININFQKGYEFYSMDKIDYEFINEISNSNGKIKIQFLDKKNNEELTIDFTVLH